MLVLRRKLGESVTIGEGIEIKVTHLTAHSVCLGVTAPADLPVRRTGVSEKRKITPRHRLPMPPVEVAQK